MGYTAGMADEPDAVYFAADDYAHFARRFGAFLVDFAFVIFLTMAALGAVSYRSLPSDRLANETDPTVRQKLIAKQIKQTWRQARWPWLAACVVYHLSMRRLRGGTLGYRVAGIRLVDNTGRAPSWRVLFKRFGIAFAFAVFFFLPLVVSYLFCFKLPKRQSGHDFWSGTWLVRKRAQPAGPALTAYNHKLLGTWLLSYIDVEPYVPEAPAAAEPEPPRNESSGVITPTQSN